MWAPCEPWLAILSGTKYGQSCPPSGNLKTFNLVIRDSFRRHEPSITSSRRPTCRIGLTPKINAPPLLLTLAERSTQASWVMCPAQAGALTYTSTPGDGLRAQILSAEGEFAQTPALCPASSENLMMHVNTLMDVTTITAGSCDPPSDLPKQAKAGEHR